MLLMTRDHHATSLTVDTVNEVSVMCLGALVRACVSCGHCEIVVRWARYVTVLPLPVNARTACIFCHALVTAY
jgi:hypothetical protein